MSVLAHIPVFTLPRIGRAVFPLTAVTVLKLALAWVTLGTNDATTRDYDLQKFRAQGFEALYREGVQYDSYPVQAFIHPPGILNLMRILGAAQDLTQIPIRFWLRFLCTLADIGTILLVWKLLHPNPRMLLLLILSPISILVSGFHTNSDPIMVFFLVLTMFLVKHRHISLSAVAFGLAASVKIVPVLFLPAILLALPAMRSRLKWLAVAAAVWICAGLPYIMQEPVLILRTILGYGSSVGLWGPYFFAELARLGGFPQILAFYAPLAKWLAIAAALVVPIVLRPARRASLFAVCGPVTLVFLLLTPGFAVQYLAWTVPWIVLFGFRDALAYTVASGAFLIAVYATALIPGARLYADFLTYQNQGAKILFGSLLWGVMAVIVYRQARRLHNSRF